MEPWWVCGLFTALVLENPGNELKASSRQFAHRTLGRPQITPICRCFAETRPPGVICVDTRYCIRSVTPKVCWRCGSLRYQWSEMSAIKALPGGVCRRYDKANKALKAYRRYAPIFKQPCCCISYPAPAKHTSVVRESSASNAVYTVDQLLH